MQILMLKASPLMHGVGRDLSSITFWPAKAAANDLVVPALSDCTIAEGTGCTTAEGTASDTHGQGHVYAISGLTAIHDYFHPNPMMTGVETHVNKATIWKGPIGMIQLVKTNSTEAWLRIQLIQHRIGWKQMNNQLELHKIMEPKKLNT